MGVTYRDRAAWGGGPVAAGHPVPPSQFVRLAEHHTVIVLPDYDHDGMTAGDIDDFDRYMRQLKTARPDLGPDVPYSFVIGAGATENDCIVGEGRGNGHTGAHTIGFNSSALGCAWAGDFTHTAPTRGMVEGLRWVGRTMLTDPTHALPTIQHRDVYATQCPGNATPSPSLAQPPFTAPPTTPPSEDDPVIYTYVKKPAPSGDVFVARHGEPPQHVGAASFGFEAAEAMVRYQGDKLIASSDGTDVTDALGKVRKVLTLNSVESQQWFGI